MCCAMVILCCEPEIQDTKRREDKLNSSNCHTCARFKGTWEQRGTHRIPHRSGINCTLHGIQVLEINGEHTSSNSCSNYATNAQPIASK